MSNNASKEFFTKKNVNIISKILLVLFAACYSALFFGVFLVFFLLAFKIIPSLGTAGVIYVFSFGIAGMLFGGISTGVSLYKSDKIISRYYLKYILSLFALTIAYLILYLSMYEKFSHI